MAVQIGCPDVERLRRLMLGKAAYDEAQSLGEHLLHCAQCAETVHYLDATDLLIQAARAGAHAARHPDQVHIAALIQRLQRLPAPSAAEALSPTAGADGAETPSDRILANDWTVLLAPPEGPGEVGRLGSYRVLSVLGAGGMGVVFEGEDTQLNRLVALKVIQPGMDSRQVMARFEAERQALAMMDHPSIAKVLDAGTTSPTEGGYPGRPYFVMELVKGVPITRYCDESRLSLRQRLELMIPICQAIQHAHQKGIIHRDVKPSNVLVTLYDGQPVPKVIDFGLTKATAQTLSERSQFTQFGQIVGTLEYMSPEQAELGQLAIDTRSDIYSLGVLLYELLTGSTPFCRQRFGAVPFDEILRMIREEEPETVSTRLAKTSTNQPGVDAGVKRREGTAAQRWSAARSELDWILMKCLEKDRNRRYESANDLALDLQRYLHDEPVQACPPSAGYRLKKFLRRNKGPVLAVAVLGLAIVAGLAGVISQSWEAKIQRNAAERQRLRAQRHYEKALAVVDRMLMRVGEKELANVPYMDETRRRLLEDALEFYRGFLQEDSADPAVRQDTARAYGKTARIYQLLGRYDQSEEAWQQAIDLQQALVEEFPDAHSYRQELAVGHRDQGRLYSETGRSPQAEASYRDALNIQEALARDHQAIHTYQLELLSAYSALGNLYLSTSRPGDAETTWTEAARVAEQLVKNFPDDPKCQDALGRCHHNLGNLYRLTGQQEESKAAFLRARDISMTLMRAYPEDPNHQSALSGTLNNLAIVYRALGQLDDAEASYLDCLDVKKKLAADHPDLPDYQMNLAKVYNNLGFLYSITKQPDKSITAYQEALTLHGDLARRFPKRLEYVLNFSSSSGNWARHLQNSGKAQESLDWFGQVIGQLEGVLQIEPRHEDALRSLHNAHFNRAVALDKLDRQADAAKDWRRVVELGEGQRHENYRLFRPKALAYLGEHARAMAALDDVAPDAPKQGWVLEEFGAVCGLSAAGAQNDTTLAELDRVRLVDQYAARSVVFLSQAAEAGLYKTPSQFEKLKKDRRLEALREREDFNKLLTKLETRTKESPPGDM